MDEKQLQKLIRKNAAKAAIFVRPRRVRGANVPTAARPYAASWAIAASR